MPVENKTIMVGVIADIPAFGVAYRIFFATDQNIVYTDTGTAWVAVLTGAADMGATVWGKQLTSPTLVS